MDFQRIDPARWERRAHHLHDMNEVVCSYSLTTEPDVTPLSGRRLYPALLRRLTATVNGLRAFRTLLIDGEPVVFSDIHPSYTVFHRQTDTFSVLRTGFDRDYTVFEKAYEADAARCGDLTRFCPKPDCPPNTFGVSMLPWTSFASFHLQAAGAGRHLRRKRTAFVRFRRRFRCTTPSATATMSADF